MGRKKNVTKENIISWYMEFVLENNNPPKSIYSFAKENNFEETEFYKFYNSFNTIEASIFTEFLHHTLTVLSKSDDYKSYDTRNKLLSFYFTFFELLTTNRSFVVYVLEKSKKNLKKLSVLKQLRKEYIDFIDELNIEKFELRQATLDKIQKKSINESHWLQLLITIKFWMDDTSASFEKTDIFIEKSINARFDLKDIKPLKSIIDFGKFILKEKVNN